MWATRPDGALTRISTRGRISRVQLPNAIVATSLAIDRSGNIWFTFEGGLFPFGGIGEISPSGQLLQLLDAAEGQPARQPGEPPSIVPNQPGDLWNVAPSAIVEGSDGTMYFAEAWLREIGQVSDGHVTQIWSGSQFASVVRAPDGRLWFGEYAGESGNVGASWNLDSSFNFVAGPAGENPTGVAVTPDGTAWFAATPRYTRYPSGRGSHPLHIVLTRVSPTGEVSRIVGRGSSRYVAKGIAAAQDNSVWITSRSEHGQGIVWRIEPNGKQTRIRASTMPTKQVELGAITEGPDGGMWFLDLSRGAIGRISNVGSRRLQCRAPRVPQWAQRSRSL